METSAGKLDMVLELYERGFLCKCRKHDLVEMDNGYYKEEIRHEANCEGRIKAQEILGYNNE